LVGEELWGSEGAAEGGEGAEDLGLEPAKVGKQAGVVVGEC